MKIKHRFTGKILFEYKTESLKLCVQAAFKRRANLSESNLSESNLRRANLSGANLSGADLSGADLRGADLSGADLWRANLSESNLSESNLSESNLSESNLREADLWRADLSGADLSGADLSGADLSGAKNIIAVFWVGFSLFVQHKKTRIGCEYRTNEAWLAMSIETAVSLGIKKEHFEAYRELLKSGIKALKAQE